MIFNYRQNKMSSLIEHNLRILDIGCSQKPNKYIVNSELIGYDLNPFKTQPSNYRNLIIDNVSNLRKHFTESSLDVIMAGEILEHLESPIEFLKDCNMLIKRNGKLVLSTPNPHSLFEFILTIFLSRRFFYHKEHVCLYPQRWLIRMFEISGFKNIRIYAGGITLPYLGDIPFFRSTGLYTIIEGYK
jgi:hypothetical protein